MRVFLALVLLSLAGWVSVFAGIGATFDAVFCAPADRRSLALPVLQLAFASPASLLESWAPMVLAMMPPLLVQPLLHIGEQSLARRRWRAMLLFGIGYGMVWLSAGLLLQPLAWTMTSLSPGAPYVGMAATALAALVWQVSPTKQACLNGCHRRPVLAAFGLSADLHTLDFGVGHGLWCLGACGPLMLLAESVAAGVGVTAAMPLAALFAFAERFERPGPFVWHLRLPRRLLLMTTSALRSRCGAWGKNWLR